MRRVVLVTRPEPGLAETMRAVAAMGWEPLAAPLLRIEPLAPTIPRSVQAVLLTSGQAVAPLAALAPWLLRTPVLAVGDATAGRARAAGFISVSTAGGDAAQLASLASQMCDPRRGALLLACGAGQGGVTVRTLRDAGFRIVRRCVYRARRAANLPAHVLAALDRGEVDAALFFSADTARAFVRLLPRRLHVSLGGVRGLAIGTPAVECLSALSWARLAVSQRPNAESLLSLL